MATTPQSILRDYDRSIARIILQCVKELPFPLGVTRTVNVLTGRHQEFNLEHQLHGNSMFGVLSPWTGNRLKEIVEQLLEQNLLGIQFATESSFKPTLILTHSGERFLAGRGDAALSFSPVHQEKQIHAFIEDLDLEHEEGEFYEALRQVRTEFAREYQLPPYTICHNKVLRELARKRPQSEEELLSIRGVGSSFVAKYGSRFLRAIASFDRRVTKIRDD